VRVRATELAAFASGGSAFLVLLLYAPALDAPFLVPKFAALEVTASLGFLALAHARASSGRPRWTGAVTAGVLLVLATTGVSWVAAGVSGRPTAYAATALVRWAALFGVACGASVLCESAAARRRVLEVVTIAAAVVAAVGLLQHVEWLPFKIPVISTPGSTFGNRNLAAEVMALALPLGLGALARAPTRDTRIVLGASLVLELLYLAVTRARGAWLGAAAGLLVVAYLSRIRLSRRSLVVVLGLALCAGIAATLPGRFNPRDAGDAKRYEGVVEVLHDSVDTHSTALRTRFGLWRRTLAMACDYPLFGVGPGNWPVLFPRYAEPGATRDGVLAAGLVPRQAHDDLLERVAETGTLGLAALLVLAGATIGAVRGSLRTDDEERRAHAVAAAGALVAVGVVSLSSFPLEMPGTLVLAGLSLGFIAVDPAPPRPHARNPVMALAAYALGLVLVVFAMVRAERNVRGSYWLGRAERATQDTQTNAALPALRRAMDATPDSFRLRLRLAQALLGARQAASSADAAEQALALEPYSPYGWCALAAAQLAEGDYASTRGTADEALRLLQDYPQALQVRARAEAKSGHLTAAEADKSRMATLAAGAAGSDTARRARALLEESP
jgi:O-antigen ligase